MNPLPEESEEYEASVADQAVYPVSGYNPPAPHFQQAPLPQLPPPALAAADVSPPPMQHPLPPQAMPMQPAVNSSLGVEVANRGHMLGFTTLASGIGMLLGVRLGGGYGAVAGTLFAGAAVNAYRSMLFVRHGGDRAKREAAVSGTYAVIAAGLGGYVLYKFKPKAETQATPNRREDGPSCLTKNSARNCGIRAII